jgi:hypothetical protein
MCLYIFPTIISIIRGSGSQIFMKFGTWSWWGCQPHAPAVFTRRKCSWYSFSLGAESTPGLCCGRNEFIILLLVFSPWGYFGQEPEPSQATGMALVGCILDKFLGLVCHLFPPRLDLPTFAARCLHVHNDARDPSSEKWNYERERLSGNFAYMASLCTPLSIFYMLKIYDMGPMVLPSLRRKAWWGVFALKNPTASAGFEPANLGTKG